MARVNIKDPQSKLDYGIDWGSDNWFAPGDYITASSWSITDAPDSALILSDQSFSGTQAGVWAAGGTVGQEYKVTNNIVTQQGRTDQRTIILQIEER